MQLWEKEVFMCPNIKCSTCICAQCADKLDRLSLHKVTMNNDHELIQSEDELEEPTPNPHDYTYENETFQNSVLIDELNDINEEDLNIQNNVVENDNMITREKLDDFITFNAAPDVDDNNFEHIPIPGDAPLPCNILHYIISKSDI